MSYLTYMKTRLIQFVIDGTQERYAEGVDPKQHVARIYLCASSYREMALLISERLPDERLNATLITINGTSGWPAKMRWVTPEVGVWITNQPNAITIYKVLPDGSKVEVD